MMTYEEVIAELKQTFATLRQERDTYKRRLDGALVVLKNRYRMSWGYVPSEPGTYGYYWDGEYCGTDINSVLERAANDKGS